MPDNVAASISDISDPLPENSTNNLRTEPTFTVYKIRWFMLFLLVMCYACVMFQILQFSIIANIVVEFYDISYEMVDWTAMIQLALYIPFVFPAMYIINKTGIREAILITMVGTCVAALIKVGSAAAGRFWVVMVAQAFIAASQVFITVLPARFAFAWFGMEETTLACGIGILGNQLGITLGCFIPTIMIKYSRDKGDIAHDMNVLNIGVAAVCTIVFILTFAFFKSEPPTPPSGSQKQLEAMGTMQFKESTVLLFKNSLYVLFLVASSISLGVFYAIPTLLNQIVLQYYPNALEQVGRIGLILNVMGVIASSSSGYIVSKINRFRFTAISIFALYTLGMVLFTLAPYHSLAALYIASVVLGYFMTATYCINLAIAAELTYPISETTSSGYLIALSQITGMACVHLYSFILYNFGPFWSNLVACLQLITSTLLVICMKFNLKRQAAENIHGGEFQT